MASNAGAISNSRLAMTYLGGSNYAQDFCALLCCFSVPLSRTGLVLICNGVRVVGYDNERGKGDHRHHHGIETPYNFVSIERLIADFEADVTRET